MAFERIYQNEIKYLEIFSSNLVTFANPKKFYENNSTDLRIKLEKPNYALI